MFTHKFRTNPSARNTTTQLRALRKRQTTKCEHPSVNPCLRTNFPPIDRPEHPPTRQPQEHIEQQAVDIWLRFALLPFVPVKSVDFLNCLQRQDLLLADGENHVAI
jgi:hypothetical protein